jgi:hypothetical protein
MIKFVKNQKEGIRFSTKGGNRTLTSEDIPIFIGTLLPVNKKEKAFIFVEGFQYQRRESNPHIRRYTILSRARLPVPPLWLGFARTLITNLFEGSFVKALAKKGANMCKVCFSNKCIRKNQQRTANSFTAARALFLHELFQ